MKTEITTQNSSHGVYAIKDAKTEMFFPPFLGKTHQEAIRSFNSACQNEQSNLKQFPEDYTLHFVGLWSDESGNLAFENHVVLAKATEFVKIEQ